MRFRVDVGRLTQAIVPMGSIIALPAPVYTFGTSVGNMTTLFIGENNGLNQVDSGYSTL